MLNNKTLIHGDNGVLRIHVRDDPDFMDIGLGIVFICSAAFFLMMGVMASKNGNFGSGTAFIGMSIGMGYMAMSFVDHSWERFDIRLDHTRDTIETRRLKLCRPPKFQNFPEGSLHELNVSWHAGTETSFISAEMGSYTSSDYLVLELPSPATGAETFITSIPGADKWLGDLILEYMERGPGTLVRYGLHQRWHDTSKRLPVRKRNPPTKPEAAADRSANDRGS
jgi:hypothetical protein